MGDIDLFFEAFTDEDVEIRRKVILVSRHISDERFVSLLLKSLEDKDYNVRTDVFETLKRSYINDERFVDYLLESLEVVNSIKRLEIIETLGERVEIKNQ